MLIRTLPNDKGLKTLIQLTRCIMNKICLSGIFVLATLLTAPDLCLAQHGSHGSSSHGGYYGHSGGYYGNYYGHGGYYGHGWYGHGYYGFGLYLGYPGYGYGYPYYYGNYPYYSNGGGYYYEPTYTYPNSGGPTTTYYRAPATPTEPPAANADPNSVNLEIRLPENASLWVGGAKMDSTGAVRRFYSPPLQPGHEYTYTLRARWTDANGSPVERTKSVDVKPGAWIGVDFSKP